MKGRRIGPLESPLGSKFPEKKLVGRYRRCNITLTEDMLEVRQSKRLAWTPCLKFNASQRMDMFQAQKQSSVVVVNSELPIVDSCMSQDILTRCTAIKRTEAETVTVLAVEKYQMRTIYIYKLKFRDKQTGKIDIVYDLLDTAGTLNINGYASFELTDLKDLEVGVEYDISEEDFYIKYPNQFDPKTATTNMGVNLRCIIGADPEASGDSAPATIGALRKLTTLKTKTVNIRLVNKVIKSDKVKYPKIFPNIGEIIEDTILFKIVNDDGIITDLSQSANVPSGVEDNTIVVEPGTFLQSIEVYCNEPITDPVLNQYREELLAFRNNVYSKLIPIVTAHNSECTEFLKRYCENFSYDQFCSNTEELKHPYIKLVMTTVDVPTYGEGVKVSNAFGAKVTIGRIYPDGYFKDEFGNSIEMILPATAIINRTVAGVLYDHTLSGISYFLHERIRRGEITKKNTYEFVTKLFEILGVSEEFNYVGFTEDELWEYLHDDYLRIILMPYSNPLNLETMLEVKKLAEKYMGYRKLTIYRGTDEVIPRSCPHEVGFIYTLRDLHDTYFGNSSISNIERNTKGFAPDKDSSKRNGESLGTKKASKIDVQVAHFVVNMASNEDVNIMMNDEEESLYAIKETNEASGIELVLGGQDADEDDEEGDN